MVSPSLVKELREMTGAGMLDCKKALDETNGNIEEAVNWLREKGIYKSAKKADRIAAEGIASILVDGNNAVIIEVNSETDFVAKNEEFLSMVDCILKTINNNNPSTIEDVLALTTSEGETIESLIVNKTAKIGEKLSLRRFVKVTKNDNEQFGSYIHMGGRIAVLIVTENTTENVAKDVAMHAAAMRPMYLTSSEVPTEVLEKEKEVIREQLLNEGKPADKLIILWLEKLINIMKISY